MVKFKCYLADHVDAIWAGVMIAIATATYLNCPNRIVGAFLFSVGLVIIMRYNFGLYTGIVGKMRRDKQIFHTLSVLAMNAVGCASIILIPTQGAVEIMQSKLTGESIFVKAIVCGILITACVNHTNDVFVTMLAIPAFILCGAEHVVADIALIFAAGTYTWEAIHFLIVVALGNAWGGLAFSMWLDKRNNLRGLRINIPRGL